MQCLKHKKSGAIVRVSDRTAAMLLTGGVYTHSTKGAFKRQTKLLARGRITLQQVGPRRSLRSKLRRDKR